MKYTYILSDDVISNHLEQLGGWWNIAFPSSDRELLEQYKKTFPTTCFKKLSKKEKLLIMDPDAFGEEYKWKSPFKSISTFNLGKLSSCLELKLPKEPWLEFLLKLVKMEECEVKSLLILIRLSN
jgi:hypothetical protein